MDLQGLATQGAAGAALGAATAAVVKFLKNLLKIFALIQFGLLTALELFGIITVKTLPNILVPMINPTLKIANLGPYNFVRPKDTRVNKIIPVNINKILFSINFDLHNRS